MTPTHIIKHYPTEDVDKLYRASDGMQLGGRQKDTTIVGENPNKAESRRFIDPAHAVTYLRSKVTLDDFKANPPANIVMFHVEVVNEEHLVVQPGEQIIMPGSGSIRKLN